tara:strand:+ start:307 stop:819 length:513 start_codon:yes stop_codon:yes gene_type:complete
VAGQFIPFVISAATAVGRNAPIIYKATKKLIKEFEDIITPVTPKRGVSVQPKPVNRQQLVGLRRATDQKERAADAARRQQDVAYQYGKEVSDTGGVPISGWQVLTRRTPSAERVRTGKSPKKLHSSKDYGTERSAEAQELARKIAQRHKFQKARGGPVGYTERWKTGRKG